MNMRDGMPPEDPLVTKMLRDERIKEFKRVCPKEFLAPIETDRLRNPEAFNKVAKWRGIYPGPLAIGDTGTGKSRAAWSALGRLYVNERHAFKWFTTKRLAEEYFEHHMNGNLAAFWRAIKSIHILFVDDLDKLELNDRNAGMVFEFYDWVYREHRPVITTTNRPREWWEQHLGAAFVRRLFDEAHFAVTF